MNLFNEIFHDGIKLVLFDGDGVLYKEDHVLSGANEIINILIEEGKQVFVLTNNSTKTRKQLSDKLNSFGIPLKSESILSSAYLTSKVVAKNYPHAKVYVVGEQGLKEELVNENIEVLNTWQEENTEDYFDFPLNDVQCLIVGMDRHLTYTKLARAMNILAKDNVQFIATNADITFPTPNGLVPGGGAMINILETLSNKKVNLIVGKPRPLMFQMALDLAKANKKETLMFGDRLETDIIGAKKVGIQSVFISTGVSSHKELAEMPEKYQPDMVISNLSDLL